MTRKTIIEHLDSLVAWTGHDPTAEPQRIHMRWLPVLALICWFGGAAFILSSIVWGIETPLEPVNFMLAMLLMPLGFGLALCCLMIGPVKEANDSKIDEYDQLMIARSVSWTYFVYSCFSVFAFFGILIWIALAEPSSVLIILALLFSGSSYGIFRLT